MTDLRTAAQQALEALDSEHPDIQLRAAVALRAALAQEEQEPAIYPDEAREMGLEEVALYTYPPRREWQSLSEEDIALLDWKSWNTVTDWCRAIEIRLKEKNYG
jgi:hypothetical protein